MDLFDDSDEEVSDVPPEARLPENGVMAFHKGVEEQMLLHVNRVAKDGDAEGVLQAIDHYCTQHHWMMHIGPEKGRVFDEQIDAMVQSAAAPCVVIEVGSYCGYSAVRCARRLRETDCLICIESEMECVKWTQRLLTKAGQQQKAEVKEGVVREHIREMVQALGKHSVDMLFLDHVKEEYLADLKVIVQSEILKPGAIVVADNVLAFGPLQEYFDYVRGPLFSSSKLHESTIEYSDGVENAPDGVEVSVFN
jgi:catechol O-methyltransferase